VGRRARSEEQDPRRHHRGRDRAAARRQAPPTVAEAAERALVSRATAYRYFPTQESPLLDVANVETLLQPVEDLFAS
jgi:AcrR family transcriptional regulator